MFIILFLFSGQYRPWMLMPDRKVSLRGELGDTERHPRLPAFAGGQREGETAGRGKRVTDSWSMLPGFQELVADSYKFDVAGSTWGNDAHWPLHITIGTGRFRSEGMKGRRYWHKKIKEKRPQ